MTRCDKCRQLYNGIRCGWCATADSSMGVPNLVKRLQELTCVMVEVCEPHPANPSRNVIPLPRKKLLAALAPPEPKIYFDNLAEALLRTGKLMAGEFARMAEILDLPRPVSVLSLEDEAQRKSDEDFCSGDKWEPEAISKVLEQTGQRWRVAMENKPKPGWQLIPESIDPPVGTDIMVGAYVGRTWYSEQRLNDTSYYVGPPGLRVAATHWCKAPAPPEQN